MSDSSPHSERWFFEYGFIGPHVEGDDPVFIALKELGFEFIYGGGVKEDTNWQGYPTEFERLQEQLETKQARWEEDVRNGLKLREAYNELEEQYQALHDAALSLTTVLNGEIVPAFDPENDLVRGRLIPALLSNPAKERS